MLKRSEAQAGRSGRDADDLTREAVRLPVDIHASQTGSRSRASYLHGRIAFWFDVPSESMVSIDEKSMAWR